jgi:GNAT superfamily N-acetyltransferase
MVKAVVARTDMHGEILDGGYMVDIECLPPDFPYHLSRWEYGDRGIAVPKTSRSVWCKVFVAADEIPVAHAVFAADAAVVRCDDVHVDRDHRRRGIADQLYQLAACLFNAPVVPSDRLLDYG